MATTSGPIFGDILRRYRVSAGMTQETLAERAGLSVRGLSDLERGARRAPHRDTVLRLAEALGADHQHREALLAAARPPRMTAPVRSALAGGAATPDAAPPAPMLNLPAALTGFVGRTEELEDLVRRLPRARLLTLTGLGGCGKTRLAIEAARSAATAFTDGVTFVDLASITDPVLVAPAIARALDVREVGGQQLTATLAATVGERRLLLVLDNFEQVLDAAPMITALLSACPNLTALVTSRAALRVSGEQEYRLAPLPAPDPRRPDSVEAVRAYPAVALFCQRAAAVDMDFTLTPENAAAVAAICAHVNGLPLSLELAAARVRLLPPDQLLEQLREPRPGATLRLLTAGPRDLPARQRTLRDTLAWSYDLLAEGERLLFRRLGAFAGSFTLDAVSWVCDESRNAAGSALADGGESLDGEVLEQLERLAEHSLVTVDVAASGEATMLPPNRPAPRYRLLETVREYALERSVAEGTLEPARARHTAYFLALAEQALPDLSGPNPGPWLQRLEREHDNLRAALVWAETPAAGDDVAIRLAGALGWFWYRHGHLGEGRRALAAARARGSEAPAHFRVRAVTPAAALAAAQGDFAAARADFDESLRLRRELGDPEGIATALNNLGTLAFEQGDYDQAWAANAEALDRDIGWQPRDGRPSAW